MTSVLHDQDSDSDLTQMVLPNPCCCNRNACVTALWSIPQLVYGERHDRCTARYAAEDVSFALCS